MEIKNNDLGLSLHIDDDKVLVWDKRLDEETGKQCVVVKLVNGAIVNIFPNTMSVVVI